MITRECVIHRIYELCDEHRWTINALARNAGVSPTTIKNILNGASQNPEIITIKLLCDGFGITLSDFFSTQYFRELDQELI